MISAIFHKNKLEISPIWSKFRLHGLIWRPNFNHALGFSWVYQRYLNFHFTGLRVWKKLWLAIDQTGYWIGLGRFDFYGSGVGRYKNLKRLVRASEKFCRKFTEEIDFEKTSEIQYFWRSKAFWRNISKKLHHEKLSFSEYFLLSSARRKLRKYFAKLTPFFLQKLVLLQLLKFS